MYKRQEIVPNTDEDEDVYYDPDHKKKVITAVLIGIIVLVTAAVLLVMAITGSFKTNTNKLDNFVGFSYDELISSNKYDYEFVLEQKKTDEVEPGIVMEQSPEAGTKVISGSQVKLVVSASMDDINEFVDEVGFPVLVRPSYVLSGAAMNVCSNQEELERFLKLAANVSKKHPVVVSQFIEHAKEVEMDAVAQNGEIVAYAISEHIEFAGVHSGDATIQFPPQKLYVETVRRIKRISREIAKALNISGPFNIQYLAKDNDIKVIECNLRASRSFPFVSKVLKINFIELATKVMLGLPVEKPEKNLFELDYVGIKASQFSFNRLQKADPVLGVDMASTGEVGCIGMDTSCAVLKAMLSVGYRIPKKNILLSTGTMKQKADMMDAARMLVNKGYKLFATGGTHKTLAENGIESTHVYWPSEEGHPQALEMLHRKEIDMVVNIPKNLTAGELSNGYKIRRAAIDLNIPLITNARLASAFINAFCTMSVDDIAIKSWAEYK